MKSIFASLFMRLVVLVGMFQPVCGMAVQTSIESNPVKQSDLPEITIEKAGDNNVLVHLDGRPFTAFDYRSYAKPIFYPIYGPPHIGMTRNWPMTDVATGEAHDHPHHKSMWIAHEISGVDFWAETGGTIKNTALDLESESLKKNDAFQATSAWIRNSDGKTMLTDQTTYRFGASSTSRWIDCTIKFMASHGDFQFDDTKEGLFAIRTHPDLRLSAKPKDGVKQVFGNALNSEGVTGKAVWGKPAKWLLYFGSIKGQPISIAMYDHPANLRHPTTWHAREYGLVTANPFGLHHFLGKEKGSGAYAVKSGDSLQLRYRVEFIQGNPSAEEIEKRYRSFAQSPVATAPVK